MEDPVRGLDGGLNVRQGDVPGIYLLDAQIPGKGKILQDIRPLLASKRQIGDRKVDPVKIQSAPGFPVQVPDPPFLDRAFSDKEGSGGFFRGGWSGFGTPGRCFVVELAIRSLLDLHVRFLQDELRYLRLPAQEGKKFQTHLQDPQLGKVCAPVAQAHVGKGDAHRREKTQRRFPLDLYIHPESLRGGGLDFGLVGIDVQEEKDREDGQYGETCQDTKKNEDFFHRVGRFSPVWMVHCAIMKYYIRTPLFQAGIDSVGHCGIRFGVQESTREPSGEDRMKPRQVKDVIEPQFVVEGAGVRLRRSIATRRLDYLDPFLLFDHFGSDNPDDYLAGFPMHPHRGIETVTYMMAGLVDHKDSLGNSGTVGAGDVQWMTSGSGIMHEEMPRPKEGKMYGFQLWVNLPAKLKMSRPRYQDVPSARIPVVAREDGVRVRVIAGEVDGVRGAVTEIYADPEYLDVSVPAGRSFAQHVPEGHAAFAYVFEGEGVFGDDGNGGGRKVPAPRLAVFRDGDGVIVHAEDVPVRFLLLSGKPLNEPIARYGPFVMNTKEEIAQALEDLRNGTFVR